jgi:hypothetical protein
MQKKNNSIEQVKDLQHGNYLLMPDKISKSNESYGILCFQKKSNQALCAVKYATENSTNLLNEISFY